MLTTIANMEARGSSARAREPSVVTVELCCQAGAGGARGRAKTFLKAERGRRARTKVEPCWRLERRAVLEGGEVDLTPFLFTVEFSERSLVVRSVAAGGKALCLLKKKGGRTRVALRDAGEGGALWDILEGRGDGTRVVLASKSKPGARVGPVVLKPVGRVSAEFILGKTSEAEGAKGRQQEDFLGRQSSREQTGDEATLVRDARALIAKLETLIAKRESWNSGGNPPRGGDASDAKGRSRPRLGRKWLATTEGGEEPEVSSDERTESYTASTCSRSVSGEKRGKRRPRRDGASVHFLSELKGREGEAALECEAQVPKVRATMPVPLKQNILAQIRQGVKLKPKSAKSGRGRKMRDGAENANPNVTPLPLSSNKRQTSGLMSELRRSLAGRRKSIGGSPSEMSETEESYNNWSPLLVNNQ